MHYSCDITALSPGIDCIESDGPVFMASNIIEVKDSTNTSSSYTNRILFANSGQVTIINNVMRGIQLGALKNLPAIYITSPSVRFAGNILMDWQSTLDYQFVIDSISADVTNNICFNLRGECFPGDSNIETDPLFVDLDDYKLMPGSPAINLGPTEYGLADLDRTRNDIGAYGGPWNIGQYDAQRAPSNYAPYVYPLFDIDTIMSGGLLEIQALGVARLR